MGPQPAARRGRPRPLHGRGGTHGHREGDPSPAHPLTGTATDVSTTLHRDPTTTTHADAAMRALLQQWPDRSLPSLAAGAPVPELEHQQRYIAAQGLQLR